MQFDTTIPLWGAFTGGLAFAGATTWVIIKFFFKVQTMDSKVNTIELEQQVLTKQLEQRLQAAKEKHQADLDSHKKETDREFERVNKKLDTQNSTLIRVETMVKLLVDNKIKD